LFTAPVTERGVETEDDGLFERKSEKEEVRRLRWKKLHFGVDQVALVTSLDFWSREATA